MGNLKSDWGFSASSLTLAETSDHFALRICAVDLKNAPLTAKTLIKINKCLAGANISVEVADIKVQPMRETERSRPCRTSSLWRNCFRRRQKCFD